MSLPENIRAAFRAATPPRTVYLVSTGCYSDYVVRAVCSTAEKAAAVKEFLGREANDVETFELDKVSNRLEQGYRLYEVRFFDLSSSTCGGGDLKGNPSYCLYEDSRLWEDGKGGAMAEVWAKSPEGAVKIANELRVSKLLELEAGA